jgi:hypothetical protein
LPLGPGHDHIGLPFAATGTDKPLAPIEDAGIGALPSSHLDEHRRCDLLSGVRLDLIDAGQAAKW